MCGMVYIPHGVFVPTNDLSQVAFRNAYMGGNLEATIENLKAVVALASLVCYNELHMFFVFVWLKCVFVVTYLKQVWEPPTDPEGKVGESLQRLARLATAFSSLIDSSSWRSESILR